MYLFTITRGLATHEIIAASKSDALAESRRVYADQYGAPIPIGRVVELEELVGPDGQAITASAPAWTGGLV